MYFMYELIDPFPLKVPVYLVWMCSSLTSLHMGMPRRLCLPLSPGKNKANKRIEPKPFASSGLDTMDQ